jgi:protoporphyrinogen oxidase
VERTDVLIIGAGLAGLCAARSLRRPFILLEKEAVPGGLTRSIHSGGSTYDFTGHLLHFKGSGLEPLIEELLPGVMTPVERRAAVFTHDRFIPYPFQANFHPLPREVVKECLLGFIRTSSKQWPEPENFEQWSLMMFGDGICRHFMRPYNEKIFRTPLAGMTADWVDWSVPRPGLETVVDGALGTTTEGLGYNPSFLYPREGGIEVLPNALATDLKDIRYNQNTIAIDPKRRIALTASGMEIEYQTLLSTMPLNRLLILLGESNEHALRWADKLRWVNVFNLNLTLRRPAPWPWQWLYLPEPRFRCYRIGVSSNISPALAPPGCCTVYAEVSHLPDEPLDESRTREEILDDLRRVGLLEENTSIINELPLRIDPAYVIHDAFRRDNLPTIHAWLRERLILSIGRWGRWEYSGMKDAMKQGFATAETLNSIC